MDTLTKNQSLCDSKLSTSFQISDGGLDPRWDSFLQQHHGHHVQSGMWSQLKAFNGWRTRRITFFAGSELIGGAQLLFRKVRFVGPIGYIPKGPVLALEDDQLASELLLRIRAEVDAQNLNVLIVQPQDCGIWEPRLEEMGFRLCPIETAPTSTVLVDLSASLDDILARMSKSMRNGVRRGLKRGITVRQGTRDDLSTFHHLLTATANRRRFSTFELEYFFRMWDILEPSGHFKLFLAELDGQAVSAQICIPFGETTVAKQIGWTGQHGRLHPNEALDWNAIKWSKDNGYRYYDLEGIERTAAQAILNGQALPEEYSESPSAYKLRLGGQVAIYPEAYCYISNPLLRSIYKGWGAQFARWPIAQRAALRFRTG